VLGDVDDMTKKAPGAPYTAKNNVTGCRSWATVRVLWISDKQRDDREKVR